MNMIKSRGGTRRCESNKSRSLQSVEAIQVRYRPLPHALWHVVTQLDLLQYTAAELRYTRIKLFPSLVSLLAHAIT